MVNDSEHIHSEFDPDEVLSQEAEKILWLTRNEALFLDDSLTMIIEREIGDERLSTVRPLTPTAGLPAPVDLLEKLGYAILFTTDPINEGKNAEVFVSDTDLYMIREITHSYIKIGEEAVGYNLKRKIYGLLYGVSYERDKVARGLLSQVDLNLPIEDTFFDKAQEIKKTQG